MFITLAAVTTRKTIVCHTFISLVEPESRFPELQSAKQDKCSQLRSCTLTYVELSSLSQRSFSRQSLRTDTEELQVLMAHENLHFCLVHLCPFIKQLVEINSSSKDLVMPCLDYLVNVDLLDTTRVVQLNLLHFTILKDIICRNYALIFLKST